MSKESKALYDTSPANEPQPLTVEAIEEVAKAMKRLTAIQMPEPLVISAEMDEALGHPRSAMEFYQRAREKWPEAWEAMEKRMRQLFAAGERG